MSALKSALTDPLGNFESCIIAITFTKHKCVSCMHLYICYEYDIVFVLGRKSVHSLNEENEI